MVLLVVVLLAVLGVRALASGGGDTSAATTTLDPDQVSPSPVTSGTPSTSPTGDPSASPTPTDGTTAVTAPATLGPCADSAVKVVLTTDATAYGPAGPPKFVVTVYNTSGTACRAEIGSAVRTFSVSDATGAVVWRSTDCQTETSSQVYDIEPEGHQAMSSTWSRQRSQSGCPADQAKVEPGAYTVNATWKDVAAPAVQFSITG